MKFGVQNEASVVKQMRGQKRTMEEGSRDWKFQNFSLPKNRLWPHISSTKGWYQTILEPLPDHRRNFAEVLDAGKCHSDDDYEDPELQLLTAWPSMKILPSRPIKESEYADTHYFKDAVEAPLLLHAKTSVPAERQTWNAGMKLREEVDKPISKDVRSQHFKGTKSTKVNKVPLPPPRPVITLPKKYQPLPPAPAEESSTPSPQRHIFPEVQPGPRSSEQKKAKAEFSHPLRNQSTQKSPPAMSSPSFIPGKHDVQDRDHMGTMQSCPQRCQPPVCHGSHEYALPYENTVQGKPASGRPDRKDIQKNEWYVGESSRQAVEEALMRQDKDGTFVVRDCSTKSAAEPYVLVVFWGNKVYNVKIRFLERNQQFALGTGLRGNEKFDSIEDIINHYKSFPIILIDGKDKAGVHRQRCYLTQSLPFTGHLPPP
ncbi:cytokine-dependent hematopoietic cell linker [Nannospalax galili]|uniref:cytokine-dependent hematopoietic cell linker n=1 Tax=Nannospalax galili TaxID=1026970 RepID=UPI000819FF55|nr:cytokine-dependent hematopoietic cell linker [Nannospalax galili]